MTTPAPPAAAVPGPADRDSLRSVADIGQLWLLPVFVGAAGILLGILVVAWPDITIKIAAVLFGIHLLVYGGFRVIQALADDESGGGQRVLLALIGVLGIMAGVLVLRNLLQAVAVIAVLLGLFWLVGGILQIIFGFGSKSGHRGFEIAMGVLGAIAGVVVLLYPEISVLALAVILGIWLILFGILGIMLGLRARREPVLL